MDELRKSGQERIRMDALGWVKREELTVLAASILMGLSLRQARQVWKRFPTEAKAIHKATIRQRTDGLKA